LSVGPGGQAGGKGQADLEQKNKKKVENGTNCCPANRGHEIVCVEQKKGRVSWARRDGKS